MQTMSSLFPSTTQNEKEQHSLSDKDCTIAFLQERVSKLEKENQRLSGAAHFLRCRDELHEVLKKYVCLVEALKLYRQTKSKPHWEYVLNMLKRVEGF